MANKITLDQLRANLPKMTARAKVLLEAAAEKSASEMEAMLQRNVTRVDGTLAKSIENRPTPNGGREVKMGGGKAYYAAHVEYGHKAEDGSQVPPQPTYHPAARIAKKRHRGRTRRVPGQVIREVTK